MEYFVKRVLPVLAIGVAGLGTYGLNAFMMYIDRRVKGVPEKFVVNNSLENKRNMGDFVVRPS